MSNFGLKKVKKTDVIFFSSGVAVYLCLLYLIPVTQIDLQIMFIILAPVSILGAAAEVFSGTVANIIIVSVISILQGYTYVRLGRVLNPRD